MKVPYSWLAEWVPGLPSPAETAELLCGIGLNVERSIQLAGLPRTAVVVEVETLAPLAPNLTPRPVKLRHGNTTHTVLSDLPDLTEGDRVGVVFLPPESVTTPPPDLPGSRTPATLASICTTADVALPETGKQTLKFGADMSPGMKLDWPPEVVFELEVTPNRADALSILGVARDLAAKLQIPYKNPAPAPASAPQKPLRLYTDALCKRLVASSIDEVRPAPSPIWLQRRLVALGLAPENNVSDITRYVTFELGQPLQAYDRKQDMISIAVRRASPKESLELGNGTTVQLTSSDMVVSAQLSSRRHEVIGLAGVVVGMSRKINDSTTSLLLEAANYDAQAVRRCARRHKLGSDAQYRFERGVDPNLAPIALARAAALIVELAGGNRSECIVGTGTDVIRAPIHYRPSRLLQIAALDVPEEIQQRLLGRLGCVISPAKWTWEVIPPTWRFDLQHEEDLVEEIARLVGYEHIPETLPKLDFTPGINDCTHRAIRGWMAASGFQEVINYAFISPQEHQVFDAEGMRVALTKPLSNEKSVLRNSLWPGLLELARNNHQQTDLMLFEIGHVFGKQEKEKIGLLVCGHFEAPSWLPGRKVDFFLLKGILQSLAASANISLDWRPATVPGLHPCITASIGYGGKVIGHAGRIHPSLEDRLGRKEIYLAELDLPLPSNPSTFSSLQRHPAAERDISVLLPRGYEYRILEQLIKMSSAPLLEEIRLFDRYEGENLPAGTMSLGVRLSFRHPERSLTEADIVELMRKIREAILGEGISLRE
ncbi:phenylalanine--tRNA ligase subunit beta [Pseudomonas citronellolis]|uniref:phenylalanine--tRNA ligase subunit beta n=1 Tax=Pseudomonas citronellolis TaxID=53408 RepID=UPI0009EED1EC|nr:phenylalanine--tRNA ligase subunit beta [Pseudomonas citronellolis]